MISKLFTSEIRKVLFCCLFILLIRLQIKVLIFSLKLSEIVLALEELIFTIPIPERKFQVSITYRKRRKKTK